MRINEFIDDFDSPIEAHEAYLKELRELAKHGDFLPDFTLRVVEWAQDELTRLDQAFHAFGRPKAFNQNWRPRALVFLGDAGHRFYTRELNDLTIIALDLELLCRLVLFLFFVGREDEDDVVSQALAVFLLLSIVVPRKESFPCVEELFRSCSQINARVTNDLFTIIFRFILFHELGHSHNTDCGWGYLKVAFEVPPNTTADTVNSIRFHSQGRHLQSDC
jgi:hypothetical protein